MEKKITKKEMFTQIIELANEIERQDIVEFCEHEIELLEKKKSNGNKKANESLAKGLELVYNELAKVERATVSELIAKGGLDELANENCILSVQKVSAYLNKLVDSGKAKKVVEKKKTYFSVA